MNKFREESIYKAFMVYKLAYYYNSFKELKNEYERNENEIDLYLMKAILDEITDDEELTRVFEETLGIGHRDWYRD